MMPHESNAYCVFTSKVCLHTTHVLVGPHLHDKMNATDSNMEKVCFHVMSHTQSASDMRLSTYQLLHGKIYAMVTAQKL